MILSSQVISTYILTIIQIYTHNSSSFFSTMQISFVFDVSEEFGVLKKNVGGGTAFLIHDSSTIVSTSSEIKSFEISSSTTKLLKSKLTAFNIYRNHYQINTPTHDPVPFSDFLIDFQTFISTAATTPHDFLITGDFNIHTDNHSDLHSQQFLSLLNNANSLNMSTFLLIRLVTHLMMSSLQKTQLYHP